MRGRAERLARLARAHAALAQRVEAQLAAETRKAAALSVTRGALLAALDSTAGEALACRGPALRRLIAADGEAADRTARIDALRHQLLGARARQKLLEEWAVQLDSRE